MKLLCWATIIAAPLKNSQEGLFLNLSIEHVAIKHTFPSVHICQQLTCENIGPMEKKLHLE